MSRRAQMTVIGLLAFTLGCPGGEPPQPSDVEDGEASLHWERVDQEVLLTPRSPDALYLVVRPGASVDPTQVSFEKDSMRIAEGVVYELRPVPLLSCPPGSECQECKPGSGDQPDCVWPPPPPRPGGFVVWQSPPPAARDGELQR